MPRFAANLTTLFNEVPFHDRFAAAAKAGFKGVEFLFPYAYSAGQLADALKANSLTQVLFNLSPGDWQAGDRGLAALPGREADFAATIETGLEYAVALGCQCVHALAGISPQRASVSMARQTYIQNIRRAARAAAPVGVTILIEPINTTDMPGYFLNTTEQARAVIDEVGEANARLQLDLYHRQIMQGNLAAAIREYADITAHIQIAGVPGRHEPDVGEIDYPYLFDILDDIGYDGWVGCEYLPSGETRAGLGWLFPDATTHPARRGRGVRA